MTSIKTFRVNPENLLHLTANEKQMLPILIRAAKIVDKIYLLQENHISNGANFYPRDAIKSEITEAAQKNPLIFSPFTIVKRDKKAGLVAITYHEEYKKYLLEISDLLEKAAKISKNKLFKHYLNTVATSLLNGKYFDADKAWLATRGNNIDIVIGPYERYLDKLFFIKRAYQAEVSVIDKERSQKAMIFRDILYTTFGQNVHRVIPPSTTDVQVRESFIFSGFLGKVLFTQQHFPTDSDAMQKYGSRILGYKSCVDYKFEKLIYPIFRGVFDKNFRDGYSKELLQTGNYYSILLYGLVQNLHRYKGSRTRLRELFPVYDEASSVASSIQHSKHLLLKGVLTQKELEAIMICQICWFFSEWIISKRTNVRGDYLKGDTLVFNFLIREGALQEKDGISWPNFAKMFFELENLSTIFSKFLEEGSYMEGQEFLSKYLTSDPFSAFERRLSSIKP